MKQFEILKKQHICPFIILFIIFPIFFSFSIFSISYANITRKDLESYLTQDNANIYIYRKPGENFTSNEIEFINQYETNNISPLYFNEPESIDIETNDYTISSYKITDNLNVIFNKSYSNHGFSKNVYSAITYNHDNKPKQNEIIKSFPNEDGIYISQNFLTHSNIEIDQITENSIIEFTAQIPLFCGSINDDVLYPELTSFVYNVNISKKISGIIKENKDLEKITDSQNLIMYPLEDCIHLMEKYKHISIPIQITNKYKLSNPIPNAYLLSSSSKDIQKTYTNFKDDSTLHFTNKSINSHYDIYSQYYLNQTFFNKIIDFKSSITRFSFTMILIILIGLIISFIKSFHFIRTKDYVKSLCHQNLSQENIIKYIKWEYLFLIFSFIIISIISLIFITLLAFFVIPNTNTNLIGIIIIEIFAYLYMWLILFIRYKKQLSYIKKYFKINKLN